MNYLTEEIQEDYSYIDRIFKLKETNPIAYKILKKSIYDTLMIYDPEFRVKNDEQQLVQTMEKIHKHFYEIIEEGIHKNLSDLKYNKKVRYQISPMDFKTKYIDIGVESGLIDDSLKGEFYKIINNLNLKYKHTGFKIEGELI